MITDLSSNITGDLAEAAAQGPATWIAARAAQLLAPGSPHLRLLTQRAVWVFEMQAKAPSTVRYMPTNVDVMSAEFGPLYPRPVVELSSDGEEDEGDKRRKPPDGCKGGPGSGTPPGPPDGGNGGPGTGKVSVLLSLGMC